MIFSAFRQACLKAPLVAALLLAAPAQAGWFSADKPVQKTESAPDQATAPATNLEESIRQAQLLRLAGQYPEAIKHLSQLMMVASDDQRVISEYGKTLAAMGRASDAVNFLTRAQQLQPNDWTVYSAMGVAYDQIGDQKSAKDAYDHALSLKPEEPSVLSNYALSRMLAKDPDMARKLAARAENAGGAGDPKIARNIAMIRSLAPEEAAPAPVQAAPVAQNPLPTQAAKLASHAPESHDNRVVMQRVPVDPQAGPVAPIKAAESKPAPVNGATHAPRTLQPQPAADTAQGQTVVAPIVAPVVASGPSAPKPVTSQPLPPPVAPVKAAETKPLPVKTADSAKPAPLAAKPMSPGPAKPVETVSASVTLRLAPPLKGETDRPGQTPKVLPPAPVKAAAKPKAGDIPGLRVSANAY